MRRSIRYTGRKELARSSVEVKLMESDTGKRVSLALANIGAFESLPASSRVKLRLFENHFSETVVFGTLGQVRDGVEPQELENHEAFSAPSVQLRVVGDEGEYRGLVLGSSSKWTLRVEGEEITGSASEGILWLQSRDISPRIWRLEIREDEQPIVYVDSRIRNPYVWARSDVYFASCVLPAVIREVFDEILGLQHSSEQRWISDWIEWAEATMKIKLDRTADRSEQKEWVDYLIDEFCRQHNLLDKLIHKLEGDITK